MGLEKSQAPQALSEQQKLEEKLYGPLADAIAVLATTEWMGIREIAPTLPALAMIGPQGLIDLIARRHPDIEARLATDQSKYPGEVRRKPSASECAAAPVIDPTTARSTHQRRAASVIRKQGVLQGSASIGHVRYSIS